MNRYLPEGSLISDFYNHEYTSSQKGLEKALEKQIILEAVAVLCDHDFNLHIDLGGKIKGIIPREEVEFTQGEETKDIAILTRVGKPVSFMVRGFERNSYGELCAVLSRRAAQKECAENLVASLEPGDIVPARVTHLESFGAFVDIGCGIISLLSIDAISVSRISHPAERLAVGDSIFTVIRSIDDRGRIYTSTRELLGTWEENAEGFGEGQTVRGIVRSVEDYGIFVELMPNLAGLAEYKEDVKVGQTAAVYIKSIIPEKMKIKLIIIDSQDDKRPMRRLKYFVDTELTDHVDRWVYSPSGSKRVIESVFTGSFTSCGK